jgi:membrane-bound inhibitor of C-type lysozyme
MRWIIASAALIGSVSSSFSTEATYRCADGTAVNAVFSPRGSTGSVRLTFAGQRRPFTLPQVQSADGGRYADSTMEFWIKGREARLTREGTETECKTQQ